MLFSFVSQGHAEAVSPAEAVALQAVPLQTVSAIQAVTASGLHERFPS